MDVILFGATGMVGQGVLRQCLLDSRVQRVLSIGRSLTGQQHSKLREIVHRDLFDFFGLEPDLAGYDACFFCLGVTSSGKSEHEYRRVTYDITIAAATTLAKVNPQMTFVFVSGAGTDSTERGRTMWARVKGSAENALLRMPFKAAYMFRPAFIQPMHGETSKTTLYRVFYIVAKPLIPLLKRLLPRYVTTTEQIAKAMIAVAQNGAPKPILETDDINRI
jgi:uncharacterized protein YbjT (DUF2867 family)